MLSSGSAPLLSQNRVCVTSHVAYETTMLHVEELGSDSSVKSCSLQMSQLNRVQSFNINSAEKFSNCCQTKAMNESIISTRIEGSKNTVTRPLYF